MAGALQARAAEEGRSAFAKGGGATKVGEKIVDERVTLLVGPGGSARSSATPFDNDGMPLGRQTWIERGVLKQLAYSRFWANKQGKTPTGGAGSLRLDGGTESLDQLIASTQRGVLVTHCWYIRAVDQRTLVFTGLTRDGTFLIENGKIARPDQELPVQRVAAVHAEQPRRDRAARAHRRRGCDAADPRARLQLHVAVGRRLIGVRVEFHPFYARGARVLQAAYDGRGATLSRRETDCCRAPILHSSRRGCQQASNRIVRHQRAPGRPTAGQPRQDRAPDTAHAA